MQDAVKGSILERFPIVGGESQWPMPAQGSTNNQTLPASFQPLAKHNLATHESAFPVLRDPHRTPD